MSRSRLRLAEQVIKTCAATLWYKHAIVYTLDVKTFQDGNGDGIGDFVGLTSRLPYIAGLGATCLWLQPFYPSPLRDDGYDVADYYAIDPRLGTFGEFAEFLQAAEHHGLRVMADLVVNHSSSDHPWFQEARSAARSPRRQWYIWSNEKPEKLTDGIVFPGHQDAVWTFDHQAKAWYHHHFYNHEPDLNIAHQAVREEIGRIIAFWLRLGLSGFRVDAAPFLLERQRQLPEQAGDTYGYVREFRQRLSWEKGDAIFLAEANVPNEEALDFFEPGVQFHMLFNFPVNQHLFLSLATQSAKPLRRVLNELPKLPSTAQWANFLRGHDELDLGRLSEEDREAAYAAFAPDEDMRLYDRGIRRRLATMLGGDMRRIQLAHSLLLTLPGTPVLRYGDEIGMGDDLALPERLGVRTPMQWSNEGGAGFSTAKESDFLRPVISGGNFGYEEINVAKQQRDPNSLLNWIERAIRVRKECPEFGLGQWRLLDCQSEHVLAYRYEWQQGAVIAVHNLSDKPAPRALKIERSGDDHLSELLGPCEGAELDGQDTVDLDPYGCRWLRLCGGRHRPA